MNKIAEVYNNNLLAGLLEKTEQGEYTFTYDHHYLNNPETSAISLTLPKTEQTYQSSVLFPFFYGLLSEGVNRQTQCRLLKIDEKDHFSLLLKTAKTDTIGSITINEITK
ncbi:MAG: HipA N-terminal domain-containing protein [Fulvivirga sp.]|uniref:HipA N-terminal domain-containing protein n=1 Tax=Fulvivirga sp. TaxID=1931237 RepID=UPI0032ECAE8F